MISFSRTDNAMVSPWGQAFSLLADIAVFPRKALTDSFFFRGLTWISQTPSFYGAV
jgi:hypothetical protein